jgi:hypothetical protein
MATMNDDELYLIARRVLLDALDALGEHRDAIVLVGAQAVYLRVGDADLALAPYTTDADLVIDPHRLAEIPPLEQVLLGAGFAPASGDSVGVWLTRKRTSRQVEAEIAVDLLVPLSVSPGSGRRAARLPGHHAKAARIVRGLDGAVVDADLMRLSALEPDDGRSVEVRVAGAGALLIAKAHKIDDRLGSDRLTDKDAFDVLRLLRGTATADLADRFRRLSLDDRSAAATQRGRALLEAQFGRPQAHGVQMAIRAAGPLGKPAEIVRLFESLMGDLLAATA